MEATKNGSLGTRPLRMAGDLLWFASASLAAGLLAAIALAALAMLLAQPAHAAPAGFTGSMVRCEAAEDVPASELQLALQDECREPIVLVLGGQEELDRLGLECEIGIEGGVHPTEHGFYRLLDRERKELGELLRQVNGEFSVGDELTDEAHVIRLAGASDVAGGDIAHCLVFAGRAVEVLRAAASPEPAAGYASLTRPTAVGSIQ